MKKILLSLGILFSFFLFYIFTMPSHGRPWSSDMAESLNNQVIISVNKEGKPIKLESDGSQIVFDPSTLKVDTLVEVKDIPDGQYIDILGLNVKSGKLLITKSGPRVVDEAVIYITQGVMKNSEPSFIPIAVSIKEDENGKYFRWTRFGQLEFLENIKWSFNAGGKKVVVRLNIAEKGKIAIKGKNLAKAIEIEVDGRKELKSLAKMNEIEVDGRKKMNITGPIIFSPDIPHTPNEHIMGDSAGIYVLLSDKECAPGYIPALINPHSFLLSGRFNEFMPAFVPDDVVINGLIRLLPEKSSLDLLKNITAQDFGNDKQKWLKWWGKENVLCKNRGIITPRKVKQKSRQTIKMIFPQ